MKPLLTHVQYNSNSFWCCCRNHHSLTHTAKHRIKSKNYKSRSELKRKHFIVYFLFSQTHFACIRLKHKVFASPSFRFLQQNIASSLRVCVCVHLMCQCIIEVCVWFWSVEGRRNISRRRENNQNFKRRKKQQTSTATTTKRRANLSWAILCNISYRITLARNITVDAFCEIAISTISIYFVLIRLKRLILCGIVSLVVAIAGRVYACVSWNYNNWRVDFRFLSQNRFIKVTIGRSVNAKRFNFKFNWPQSVKYWNDDTNLTRNWIKLNLVARWNKVKCWDIMLTSCCGCVDMRRGVITIGAYGLVRIQIPQKYRFFLFHYFLSGGLISFLFPIRLALWVIAAGVVVTIISQMSLR